MEYLLTAAQMQRCDKYMIERLGVPAMVLMERASLAVVEEMLSGNFDLRSVLVVCGSGNNGGDGFAVARLLWERGVPVCAAFVGRDASMTPECRMQRQICENCGIKIGSNFDASEYTTIVDAMFGIGISRPVEGHYAEVIRQINRSSAGRVAVDIPSGVSADTGQILGVAVRADLTVTFAAKKIGQLLYPGAEYCGVLVRRDVGIVVPRPGGCIASGADSANDRREAEQESFAVTYGKEDLLRIPVRPPYSNKGSYGKVLLIAGSPGMSGAACLCARAAYRCGSGLVRVFTPECNRAILQQSLPEAMVTAWQQEAEAMERLSDALAWADVVGIGPGLGTSLFAERLLKYVLANAAQPVVIDADALNLLAKAPGLLRETASDYPLILTPHIGELSRLTGKAKEELLSDLIGSCRRFAAEHRLICVAKDARTVVSDGVHTYINPSGNSGMATGGSGDVLTGTLCGLLAQKAEPFAAATLGVYLHGLAGDCACEQLGSHAMLAGDIAEHLGSVLRETEERQRAEQHKLYRSRKCTTDETA